MSSSCRVRHGLRLVLPNLLLLRFLHRYDLLSSVITHKLLQCYFESLLLLGALANRSLALYLTRASWLPHLPPASSIPFSSYIYTRLRSSFTSDIEEGLTSSEFDLSANVAGGDSRAGLDEHGRREVKNIMRKKKVGFDEARRLWVEERFRREGISADGRPRDPKFVSFS